MIKTSLIINGNIANPTHPLNYFYTTLTVNHLELHKRGMIFPYTYCNPNPVIIMESDKELKAKLESQETYCIITVDRQDDDLTIKVKSSSIGEFKVTLLYNKIHKKPIIQDIVDSHIRGELLDLDQYLSMAKDKKCLNSYEGVGLSPVQIEKLEKSRTHKNLMIMRNTAKSALPDEDFSNSTIKGLKNKITRLLNEDQKLKNRDQVMSQREEIGETKE